MKDVVSLTTEGPFRTKNYWLNHFINKRGPLHTGEAERRLNILELPVTDVRPGVLFAQAHPGAVLHC